jgi:hypothetical protein
MVISYFKRYRMEVELAELPAVPPLPAGHSWLPWDETLLDAHADVKFQCFQDEVDAIIFPNLGNRDGCRRLMAEIRRRPGRSAAAAPCRASPSAPSSA